MITFSIKMQMVFVFVYTMRLHNVVTAVSAKQTTHAEFHDLHEVYSPLSTSIPTLLTMVDHMCEWTVQLDFGKESSVHPPSTYPNDDDTVNRSIAPHGQHISFIAYFTLPTHLLYFDGFPGLFCGLTAMQNSYFDVRTNVSDQSIRLTSAPKP